MPFADYKIGIRIIIRKWAAWLSGQHTRLMKKKIRYLPSAVIYSNNASGAEQMPEADNWVRGARTQPLICVGFL